MSETAEEITAIVAEELAEACPPGVRAIAEAARCRHEGAVQAVLFYGSCLRGSPEEGSPEEDSVVDLYLLVESYRAIHRNPLLRLANAVLPPNVYYLEAPFEDRVVRAKYAVLSLPHFERLVAARTLQSYFWARFAQPVRLPWVRDRAVQGRVAAALAQAAMTAAGAVRPLLPDGAEGRALFVRAFRESYRSELRSEREDRAAELCDFFGPRYDRLAGLLLRQPVAGPATRPAESARRAAAVRWRRRRILGKTLSVLRLMKAAFTFTDGARYLLWKIERHSGVRQDLTPWQSRHPILASSVLFWRLYRKGAFR